MHFVDNVYFVASGLGGEQYLVFYLPDIVHAGIGCAVYFDNVHAGARADSQAVVADPAGVAIGVRHRGRVTDTFAVERAGKDAGGARFAAPPRPGKQVRMGDFSALQGIFQGGNHKFLPCLFVECFGAAFGCGNFVCGAFTGRRGGRFCHSLSIYGGLKKSISRPLYHSSDFLLCRGLDL